VPELDERSTLRSLGLWVDLILCGRDFVGVGGRSGVETERRPSIVGD